MARAECDRHCAGLLQLPTSQLRRFLGSATMNAGNNKPQVCEKGTLFGAELDGIVGTVDAERASKVVSGQTMRATATSGQVARVAGVGWTGKVEVAFQVVGKINENQLTMVHRKGGGEVPCLFLK